MFPFRIAIALTQQLPLAPGKRHIPHRLVHPGKHFSSIRRTSAPVNSHTEQSVIPQSSVASTKTIKLAFIGSVIGALSGIAYSIYNNWMDKNTHIELERTPQTIIRSFPDGVKITKRYINPKDTSGLDVVLFQFQTCPFCCKVRAFLDYMGISYSIVEVNAVLRQDIKWSKQKKVPMVLVRKLDGSYIQMADSSAIISLFASCLMEKNADVGELVHFYPNISFFDDSGTKKVDIMNKYFLMYQNHTPKGLTKEMEERERKWRLWADNYLVHLISPNCYRTLDEALETFEWFAQAGEWDLNFPKWECRLMVYAGATAMWIISKFLKRRHDLKNDVRSHIYNALDIWTSELKKQKSIFLGGEQPNLADLAVYGVLSSMEGCKAFKDCLLHTDIGGWFYDVKERVQNNRGLVICERDGIVTTE